MNKLLALIIILLISPLIGGAYGLVHDQLTYSISEEYYTKFKFIQFGIEDWGMGYNVGTKNAPEIKMDTPRIGASIVGILATWWFGLIIGITMGLIGLIHRNGSDMLKTTLKSMALIMVVAFCFGLIGLGYGKFYLANHPPYWYYPYNLLDKENFIAVGSMHNFSYIGGIVGLISGINYSISNKRRKQLD